MAFIEERNYIETTATIVEVGYNEEMEGYYPIYEFEVDKNNEDEYINN